MATEREGMSWAAALSSSPLPLFPLLPVRWRTKISPVESEENQTRSSLSMARPAGRKQLPGQLPRSGLVRTSTAAVVLECSALGWPSSLLKATLETR
jgi:hypothetical protein